MSNAELDLSPVRLGQGLPLHRQVETAIRQLVANAPYADGALLPDELTIANRLGVSRGTARMAMSRLVQDGVLERRAGVGTRVARRPAESAIGAWSSFSREMATRGITVQSFQIKLKRVPATEPVAAALRIESGQAVWRLDRVRGWDDVPVLRARSWFHPRVRFADGETFDKPLYEIIAQSSGLQAGRAHESFLAVAATAALARDLRITAGSPLLLRRHTVLDAGGRPMELSEIHYVSDRFALTLDLVRGDL